MTTTALGAQHTWHVLSPEDTLVALDSNAETGLDGVKVERRLTEYGPNELASEPPPLLWVIALAQLKDPMSLMLIGVTVASLLIGQVSTAVLVGLLVVLNVTLGSRRELAAQESVDALARTQIPTVAVIRNGSQQLVPASELVPGDVIRLEAGDVVPADGRVLRSATLECQEAALTGESTTVGKSTPAMTDPDVPLGDRENMVFQNTSVTRGSGRVVITATGMATEMGRIAGMLSSVERTRSPLQKELDSLVKVVGGVAWGAVALTIGFGLARGLDFDSLLFLGTAMAISAIPTGLPTFVQGILSYGAKLLAEAKAIVKNLTDVETLGATSAINSDKTGTLTMNQMLARQVYFQGQWFHVEGSGYEKSGAILAVAGAETPDFTRLAYGLALDSDATVADDGSIVGDPTEAALVVLAAKVGVDAEETRRAYPRVAEVPFDSEYKFMATYHDLPLDGETRFVQLVKGAPDVVISRSSEVVGLNGAPVPMESVRQEVERANERLSESGLRVLAFAARILSDDQRSQAIADPMSLVDGLRLVALVGIIDPLRPAAKDAVKTAMGAGIDLRMITGDHVVTARAIADELGLGAGGVSGLEFAEMTDDEVKARLDGIHVLGRVTPQDKLRLVQLMQEEGLVVAMTGDAVNDAAALKQADIGVAMGSGSEVSKQAAKMILTDDNFGTLVRAIELGRSIYQKVVSYVRYQMSQLIALVLLFTAVSVAGINDGVALTPAMALFLNFMISIFPVWVTVIEPLGADIMAQPPRDPAVTIANSGAVRQWLLYGFTLFLASLVPLIFGRDDLSPDGPSAAMTMAFVVMSLGTILSGLVMRRPLLSGFDSPINRALRILSIPVAFTVLGTELGFMQRFLTTQSLSGDQWLLSIALAALVGVVVEVDKWLRRRRLEDAVPGDHIKAPASVI